MPGPKMGARPLDFDEDVVRQSPTFIKWQALSDGQSLRYACRDFIKGHGDDEERLMRRIMIARRNNLRDHEILKRARTQRMVGHGEDAGKRKDTEFSSEKTKKKKVKRDDSTMKVYGGERDNLNEPSPEPSSPASIPRKRRGGKPAFSMSDAEVVREMDVPAVEATRSYKAWLALDYGKEFTYNQRYIKGHDGHDWLLKKNIWRRMRYRRENKKMVEKLKVGSKNMARANADQEALANAAAAAAATQIVDQALLASAAEVNTSNADNGTEGDLVHAAVIEAAVAAAESYVQKARESDSAEMVAVAVSSVPIKSKLGEEGGAADTSDNCAEEGTGAPEVPTHIPVKVESSIESCALEQDVPSANSVDEISHDQHQHTLNPLVDLDGSTLDVAAKLAAAASAVEHAADDIESKEIKFEVV